uniref:Uncharacterized protein n=1 Tax=Anguilla anguilla TaxID=7936 RepID=A0A0E9PYE0_ANGAN
MDSFLTAQILTSSHLRAASNVLCSFF